jgi:Cytochrome c.
MWKKWKGLRAGEKILFGIVIFLGFVVVQNFASLEWIGYHSPKPLYPILTHYDFSPDGKKGSVLFRTDWCTECHRAIGNGTSSVLDLDGEGSRRSEKWIEAFLAEPAKNYGAPTFDHGPTQDAAWVAKLPAQDRHYLAVFLSELTADRGAPDAKMPPQGKSSFIDDMLRVWAPESWRIGFSDIRNKEREQRNNGQ